MLPMTCLLLAQGSSFGLHAQTVQVPAGSKEVIAMRDRFSKHFALPDGSMRAYIASGSLHYTDANGNWQDIDCSLHASSKPGYAAENNANSISSHYMSYAGEGVHLSVGESVLEIAIEPRLETFSADGNLLRPLQQAKRVAARWSGNAVVYSNIFTGADNVFRTAPDQVKNNLVLAALPSGISQDVAFLAYTEEIRVPDGWNLRSQKEVISAETVVAGPLTIVNEHGLVVFVIPVPDVFEQNDPAESVHADGRWEQAFRVRSLGQGRYVLSTLVPLSWLADGSRQYPVVIDPTVTLAGNWGGWQNTQSSYLDQNPSAYVFTGLNSNGATYHSYTQFDVSSIPNLSIVTDTRLKAELNGSGNTSVTETILINDITGALGPYSSYSSSAYTDMGNGNYTSFSCTGLGTYGFYDLGTDADSDVMASLASGDFQVGFSIASPTTWKRFTSNLNYLEVTYLTCTPTISATASAATYSNGFNVGCHGDTNGSISTTVTGGSSYTYSWTGPNGYTSTAANPTDLAAGIYHLSVYDNGDPCPDTLSIALTEPEELVIWDTLSHYIGGKNVSCKGASDGSINLGVTGSSGYTYDWSGPGGFMSTAQDISGLAAGAYYLVVTESTNSCTVADTFTLSEPFELFSSITDSQDAYCANDANGMAEAGASGGTQPYAYMWNNAQTTALATGLSANTPYTVTVTDVNGCTDTSTVFIGAQHELPVVNLGPPDTGYCAGGNVLLNAGAGFMSYLWSDGSTGQILAVTSVGIYMVTVTNFGGCSNSDQINVNQEYDLPTPNLGPNVATASVPVALDAGPYEAYFWNTGAMTAVIDVFTSGTYTVTVTDHHGCKGSDEIKVTIWPTGTEELPGAGIRIYPVPAHDVFTLQVSAVADPVLNARLLDALGQTVAERKLNTGATLNETFYVGHLPKGTYFLQLTGVNTHWRQAVVVH